MTRHAKPKGSQHDADNILALSEALAGLAHAVETAEHPTPRGLLLKSMKAVADRIIP
jgi:hypothetical protein